MSVIRYKVDMVQQQSSPVCWLACTTMLIQFKRRLTPNSEMLGIANVDFRQRFTKGLFGNAVWTHMSRLGLTNARSSELHISDPKPCQNMIYQQLIRNGPFILHHDCGSFSYGPNVITPTTGAHSVLIVGTDTRQGCVWFNNPWGTSDVMTTTASIVGAIVRWERNRANMSISYMNI